MCQQLLDDKFQCLICGSSIYPLKSVGSPFPILSKLQVIGAGPKLQKCHGCNSSDRDRLVYLYLRDIEKVFSKGHASVSVFNSIMEHKGYLSEEECIKRYGQKFHKRIYNVEGYIDRLRNIGFKVEEIKISKRYPIESVNPNEVLFIANK